MASPFRWIVRIPAVDDSLDRVRRRFLSEIVVRRIEDPQDLDLSPALDLYEDRIPIGQRFESADIIRWLREDSELRAGGHGPSDTFLIAKRRRKVCGFILFHYYPRDRILFFAYLVVAKGPGIPTNRISEAITKKARKVIRWHPPFSRKLVHVLEVEDPRRQTAGASRNKSLARIIIFSRIAEASGLTLRGVDFAYLQPPLTHDENPPRQEPLLLMLAEASAGARLGRNRLADLVDFIYTELYPSGYSNDPHEVQRYKDLCQRLGHELKARIPTEIPLLTVAQLRTQLKTSVRPPRS
jgi:hypothetical protein